MFLFSLIDFNLTPLEIAGNILTFIGMVLFLTSSFCRKKKNILLFQTGNHSISSIGEIFLGQISGAIQDGISIIRNIFFLLNKNNKVWNIIFIVSAAVLGTVFNIVFQLDEPVLIAIGFLPVIASLQYSIVVLFPNIKVPYIKASMAFSSICWLIYGLFLKNYSMAIFNAAIFIVSIGSILQYMIHKKKGIEVKENIVEDNQQSNEEV
ncbi:MAG: YgjV family protein [Anaeroplasmataceae bacterium]|nr:YgjV family protein [Anaeroplasmataceae bacterium]